jgi:muramoyltetrapeptide carboxypeptidase
MTACFDDLLLGQGEGAGWRQHRETLSNMNPATRAPRAVEPVTAAWSVNNAKLWGGNLTILSSLLGTPYFPEIKGGILFLEDVGEHPYRIERMLTQLLHSGVLARQKAIVMGQFTDFNLVSHDRGFRLQSVVDWLRMQVKVPVLTNLPYGHVATKVLLPVGSNVNLNVEGRDALLFWGHL